MDDGVGGLEFVVMGVVVMVVDVEVPGRMRLEVDRGGRWRWVIRLERTMWPAEWRVEAWGGGLPREARKMKRWRGRVGGMGGASSAGCSESAGRLSPRLGGDVSRMVGGDELLEIGSRERLASGDFRVDLFLRIVTSALDRRGKDGM